MQYLTIKRRLLNAIPHYILHFIIFNLLSGFLIIGLEMGSGDMQAAPFVVMQMLIFPIDFIISTLMYPNGYEVDLAYFILFGLMLATKSIYFTILDYLSINEKNNSYTLRTTKGEIPSIQAVLTRNVLKSISRVFLMIPLLPALFSKERQALYDYVTGVVVLSGENIDK